MQIWPPWPHSDKLLTEESTSLQLFRLPAVRYEELDKPFLPPLQFYPMNEISAYVLLLKTLHRPVCVRAFVFAFGAVHSMEHIA